MIDSLAWNTRHLERKITFHSSVSRMVAQHINCEVRQLYLMIVVFILISFSVGISPSLSLNLHTDKETACCIVDGGGFIRHYTSLYLSQSFTKKQPLSLSGQSVPKLQIQIHDYGHCCCYCVAIFLQTPLWETRHLLDGRS